MLVDHVLVVALTALFAQASAAPPYVLAGDRVEERLQTHSERLEGFFSALRGLVDERAPELLPELEVVDAPPQPGVYGYQLLPPIVDEPDPGLLESISSFSYSWSVTTRYIEGEDAKLTLARERLTAIDRARPNPSTERIRALIADYHAMVDNQATIDQYVQYNRFWQRAIATDRARFDRLTSLYDQLVSGEPGVEAPVRESLGRPAVPGYIGVEESGPGEFRLSLPVYTDIRDLAFLNLVESAVETMWSVQAEGGPTYMLDIEFRRFSPARLYLTERTPEPGDHLDLASHVERFPTDGALLTTGAESTHGFVGRYVALGPGEITIRTLAHEFGHVLGFADGYVRGYRDLGDVGFEILELTSGFDDIMSAPREGEVLPSHFELLIEGLKSR